MTLEIVFDTETTGIPDWKVPSDAEHQPHIVQLAAQQFEPETGKIIQTIDVIIKPNGWVIPAEVSAIHGITTEYANDVGISEKLALEMFLELWGGRLRIAHNTTFDNRIIKIATKRYCSEEIINLWHEGDYFCTMINARKAMPISKNPTLGEAYTHFTGKNIEDAHSALADTQACREVYLAINKLRAIEAA
jgi:DNA polymerase III subunit epsilon